MKEISFGGKAATGELVLLQPAQGILDILVIYIDIFLGLAKTLGYKSCQPRKRMSYERNRNTKTRKERLKLPEAFDFS